MAVLGVVALAGVGGGKVATDRIRKRLRVEDVHLRPGDHTEDTDTAGRGDYSLGYRSLADELGRRCIEKRQLGDDQEMTAARRWSSFDILAGHLPGEGEDDKAPIFSE